MSKKVLILSGSPRKGGNSDLLCDEFMRGAQDGGNTVEKIRVVEKKIAPCIGCYYCDKNGGKCVQPDDTFMVTVEKFMRHGCENVPDYMISGSRGDFTGVGDIHFFYSADEVLYGALPDFEEACKRANVPYTVSARPKMVHCYCMLPIFKEAKEDFAKIVDILKK